MAILSVLGVSKAFRGIRALDAVSFEVGRGEILGVIGPNGAGKTTLFSVLAGALPPDAGRVVLDGRNITGGPAHRVARAGLVRTFQLMRPFASMSVLDNVCIAAMTRVRSRREAHTRAVDVVRRVGLKKWQDARADTLPTAWLKRLELARALATRPRVLLLDEVLAGLAPAEREPVLDLLAGLRERDGLTMVFVEHVMAAVMRLSDRVLVLDQGAVLMSGPPDQVTADPRVIEVYLGEEPC
jgi:branched-chain amino acid transport system ATP-binding protein